MTVAVLLAALAQVPIDDAAAVARRFHAWAAREAARHAAETFVGPPDSAATPIPTRGDLLLAAAVEDFARAAPPEPYRGLIERLGASGWRDRERASAALLEALMARPAAARWLFWGRRHRDPEVMLRSNTLLRRLYRCVECRGTGLSRFSSEWGETAYPCGECDGAGSRWPLGFLDG